MSEQKKSSGLPFSPPPGYTGASARPENKPAVQKLSKKDLKKAKRASRGPRAPISVRGLIGGLVILIGCTVAVTAVISPSLLNKIMSGQIIQSTDTCKVIETNSTDYFKTSCGVFKWNPERLPGHPEDKLIEGHIYTFNSVGIRIAPAQVFPILQSYVEAAPKK